MRTPKVSVLMSCYNAVRWLSEAIDSVLTQTFKDFEFILVDDGSTDKTREIIQSYAGRDKRIVAIFKENTGLADSLNAGMARARGEWIARMDADDLCEPARLEEQVDFVLAHPEVVLLGTGFLEIDGQGGPVKKHLYPPGHNALVHHLERMQRFFPHSSAFYRLDIVRLAGGYNPCYHRAQDWQLWLELIPRGKIACLSSPLVRVRKHAAQVSHENDGSGQYRDATAATVCYFLRKSGCEDPSVFKLKQASDFDEWSFFLKWVEKRIGEIGAFEKRKAWCDARTKYFSAHNRLAGLFCFANCLLLSGCASALLWEKFFGSSLPRRLAVEWSKSGQ